MLPVEPNKPGKQGQPAKRGTRGEIDKWGKTIHFPRGRQLMKTPQYSTKIETYFLGEMPGEISQNPHCTQRKLMSLAELVTNEKEPLRA